MLLMGTLWEYLSKSIMKAVYGIMLILDGLIYSLIGSLYKIFQVIASAQIFSNDLYLDIAGRIQVVIGVAMLFVLAYALLRAVINPDDLDSKTGISVKSIVPSFVKTVILIALVPTLFTYAYKAQNIILQGNVIGKIVVGKQDASSFSYTDKDGNQVTKNLSEEDIQKAYIELGGTSMAQLAFQTFFYLNDDGVNENGKPITDKDTEVTEGEAKEMGLGSKLFKWFACAALVGGIASGLWIPAIIAGLACIGSLWDRIFNTATMTLSQADKLAAATGKFDHYVIFVDKIEEGIINYSWFLSTICGLFICYILISFCIDLGLRAVKLGYYQIIAPVPIFANLLPKGKEVFDKWVKNVMSTFFGVFIRVLIIFLVIYLISALKQFDFYQMMKDSTLSAPSNGVKFFARLFIILGLLMFAKQAPKIISESFGISDGSLKLGIKDKLTEANVFRAGSAIGSGVTAGVRNFNATKGQGAGKRISSAAAGLTSGTSRGFKAGKDAKGWSDMKTAAGKGAKETTDKRDKRAAYQAEHGNTGLGALGGHIEDFIDGAPKWAGAGIRTGDYANAEKLKKEIEVNDQVSKSRTDLFDLAEKISNPGKDNIKLNLDDAKLIEHFGLAGKTAAEQDAKLKEVLGDNYRNMTYGTLEQIQKSGKTADGQHELDAEAKTGLNRLVDAQKGYVKNGVISGKIGKNASGKWVNTDVDVGETVIYDPNLTASIQSLQKELINAYKTLGKDNSLFQNDMIRAFADGTAKLADYTNGNNVNIGGVSVSLGEATGGKYMKVPIDNNKAELNIKLSDIQTRIEEAKAPEKK